MEAPIGKRSKQMAIVEDYKNCPLCRGTGTFTLNTDTNEQEFGCGSGSCGFAYETELRFDKEGKPKFWVVTTWYPMEESGRVFRPEGKAEPRFLEPTGTSRALRGGANAARGVDSHDVQFGDPELMKWDYEEFIKGFRPMPPEIAEGKTCDMRVCGGKYILPSDRVIHLTLGHVVDTYKLGFEIVYPESAEQLMPVPGKLVFIKHNVYDCCGRPALYFNPGDDDLSGEYQYLCGVCCGKEELPPDRPTLTIEMLESAMDKLEAAQDDQFDII
jgi:hypothetical protein